MEAPVLAAQLHELLVSRAAIARERPAAIVADLTLPAVDEAGPDVEVAGSLGDATGALSGADGFEFVLGGEGSAGGHGRVQFEGEYP